MSRMYLTNLELPFSNAKPEATNNLIKVIKRNAFGFRKMKTLKNGFSLPFYNSILEEGEDRKVPCYWAVTIFSQKQNLV